ncbi:MAG: RNA polymerase sigma factor [Lewinellaceae bacterium]|nr:RNA polymerase sigma factor [Lewinellaceae bacterium]
MKVINRKKLPVTEQELLEACKNDDRLAQRLLYDRYSPDMFGLCLRYVKNREDAEDVLVEAFFKVFDNIGQYMGLGSFEGWIRRIVVNEALMFLRRRHNFNMTVEISESAPPSSQPRIVDELSAQDILGLLGQLPTGYRTVFNLYVLEGYKHREIADMLGISINTSKSQLILAKKRLQELLEQAGYQGFEESAI